MIASGIGRGVAAAYLKVFSLEFFPLLNLFLTIVMGTFILKDDEHLKGFYECLATSICSVCAQHGMGGLRCLMPFVLCTGVNGVFDLLLRYKTLQIMPYGIFLAGSILSEGIGCYYGWMVQKRIRDNDEAAMEDNMGGMGGFAGGGGGFGGPGGRYEMAGGPAPPSSATSQAPPQQNIGGDRPPGSEARGGGAGGGGGRGGGGAQQASGGFQAFQGQGQRLGS